MPRFSRSLTRVKRDMDEQMAIRVIRVTTALHDQLVRKTPVDTGWARANWTPGLQPPIVPRVTHSSRDEAKAGAPAAAARAQHGLAQVIFGYKSLRQGVVWIVTNVPYIPLLNATHSKKSGFIERSIDAALLKVIGTRLHGRRPTAP